MGKYTKKKWPKAAVWTYSGTSMLLTVASHAHYSYDVAASLLVCTLVWHAYHNLVENAPSTVAKGASLQDRSRVKVANFIRRVEDAHPKSDAKAVYEGTPETINHSVAGKQHQAIPV
eukprot:NODE_4827_length_624_cov_82.888696_g4154_i0.p1 GENE.NODE_4827_length_624_cov_82.888696_g4154_i0~~NODE_4827_length_624_cov_82.888696_g4154_i0.p1  ORF type:complete len:128 (+),score=45.21 NODE_4827_length_624_cov_82.888696_g4154_i0:34-384(+)